MGLNSRLGPRHRVLQPAACAPERAAQRVDHRGMGFRHRVRRDVPGLGNPRMGNGRHAPPAQRLKPPKEGVRATPSPHLASDNESSVTRIGPVFPVVSAPSRDYGDVGGPVTRLESAKFRDRRTGVVSVYQDTNGVGTLKSP